MFEFLEGTVVDITPTHIVLLVGGVGYLINTANPYRFNIDDQKKIRVYIYQSVSDTAILLFGFATPEDKQIFEKLISVSGIGPKSALAILAGNDRDGLISAINNEDVKFLTKFPGVGKKTARQIILDMQGKLDDISVTATGEAQSGPQSEKSPELSDALSALEALGYPSKQIDGIQSELAAKPGLSTDQYLSLGLKLLMH